MSGCLPPWLVAARAELEAGVFEAPGPADDPRVLEYLAAVPRRYLADALRLEDETPWCGAFVTWAMVESGIAFPAYPARARSWLAWGRPIAPAPVGALCVLARGREPQPGPEVLDAQGHVGILVDRYADELLVLGGNQGDRVSIRPYPLSRLLGFRWQV